MIKIFTIGLLVMGLGACQRDKLTGSAPPKYELYYTFRGKISGPYVLIGIPEKKYALKTEVKLDGVLLSVAKNNYVYYNDFKDGVGIYSSTSHYKGIRYLEIDLFN